MVEMPMIRASGIVNGAVFPKIEESSDFMSNWLALVNDDLSSHPMMYGTEVRVSSCGREGVGEALSRLQYRRLLELIVGARHRMAYVVVVSPGHRGAHGYGEGLR